ncbi:hypothetical protein PM082_014513 [Marasmius tenuissimus]|nr:hypothetical protein PM082_014513 [Marasmius tenuissimus]
MAWNGMGMVLAKGGGSLRKVQGSSRAVAPVTFEADVMKGKEKAPPIDPTDEVLILKPKQAFIVVIYDNRDSPKNDYAFFHA